LIVVVDDVDIVALVGSIVLRCIYWVVWTLYSDEVFV